MKVLEWKPGEWSERCGVRTWRMLCRVHADEVLDVMRGAFDLLYRRNATPFGGIPADHAVLVSVNGTRQDEGEAWLLDASIEEMRQPWIDERLPNRFPPADFANVLPRPRPSQLSHSEVVANG